MTGLAIPALQILLIHQQRLGVPDEGLQLLLEGLQHRIGATLFLTQPLRSPPPRGSFAPSATQLCPRKGPHTSFERLALFGRGGRSRCGPQEVRMSRFGSSLLDALLSLISFFHASAADGDTGSILDPNG